MGDPKGSKRLMKQSGNWQLRAYAGISPVDGSQMWLSATVPGSYSDVDVDVALGRLVARAVTIREQAKERREQDRIGQMLGDF